mmetsp:Transcript_53542/g.117226  ORF Transcript_53542/g.117226 Transcript_53542/m.117226 type:complete len:395 (+) Transcript_53542:75-1259(+)|eukprot:CAMPEP_0206526738 /NCGR_PEP_ID=MMETSP0325_2-20121206/926_1 /ASSEMBLY_ACC=CAM_ASM_000347 /TAXON_ID=2866 /ORGANISM="Crypthecodinium cohnii, Strain Seligo" /LENGTH=394 /DNA_ID=CAMNT_0054022003 /DNA_START=49 /DNA_END=1233 /DNA_ORIENTATION=+
MASVAGQPSGEQPPVKRKRATLTMLPSASARAATAAASPSVTRSGPAAVAASSGARGAAEAATSAAASSSLASTPAQEADPARFSAKAIVLAGIDGSSLPTEPEASNDGIKGLAADPSGEWEVWVKAKRAGALTTPNEQPLQQKPRKTESSATAFDLSENAVTLRGVKLGKPVWDLELRSGLTRLVLSRGIFAVVCRSELQVFCLSSARLVLPPIVLGAGIVSLELSPEGKWLLVACRDGSLSVYDLEEARNSLRTSLQGIASPDDVVWVKPRASNGQPVLRLGSSAAGAFCLSSSPPLSSTLRKGQLLCFDGSTQTWCDLGCSVGKSRQLEPGSIGERKLSYMEGNPEKASLHSDLEALGVTKAELRQLELVQGSDCVGQSGIFEVRVDASAF